MNILELLGAFPILGFGVLLVFLSVVVWRDSAWCYWGHNLTEFALGTVVMYMVGMIGLCVTGLGLFMLVDGLV